MKKVSQTIQSLISKHIGFFLLAVLLFWAKTYIAYRIEFHLGISNTIQKFLLFFNPASSAILFLGLALFAKGRKSYIYLIIINFFLSFVLYANIVYYRFFTDFITLPTLTQTKNFGDLGGSVWELLNRYDALYFLDTILLIALLAFRIVRMKSYRMNRRQLGTIYLTGILLLALNLGLAESDRPQLLTRTFDRNYLVKYLGAYNYTIYDAIQSTKSSAQRAFADSNDITDIVNYTKSTYAEPDPQYFGVAKGKNVIYIHLESFQNFLIDYQLNGQEVTPFLNSLTRDGSTFYFDNFFHQTGQGKTSDAEFMLENSMFGLPQGSVFTTKAQNTLQSAPAILGQQGYTSAIFHGNGKTFWNRDEMYKSFGVNKFFDSSYYNMSKENISNYGLKDKPFFTESIPLLETVKEPFYAKFITLSNHFPYTMPQEETSIEAATTGDSSVDRYFQTARYLDESVQQFFTYLKESGLYDRSVIVLYGDHYGISENHDKAMSKILGKEINNYEEAQLQRVPLFIHVPGVEGSVNHSYGGQVDLLPTLLHLLGTDTKDYIQFGTDLLSPQHSQVVPFRNGNFVSPSVTSVNGKYYDAEGTEIESNDKIKQMEQNVEQKLQMSDKTVYEDLLRFHTPKGFKPVNRENYNYNNTSDDKKEETK